MKEQTKGIGNADKEQMLKACILKNGKKFVWVFLRYKFCFNRKKKAELGQIANCYANTLNKLTSELARVQEGERI